MSSTLYCMVLAMFEQYQTVKRYAYVGCSALIPKFCLALPLIFLSAFGSMAQTKAAPDLGPDQTIPSGATVRLGAGSVDAIPGYSYHWTRTGGTGDGSVALSVLNNGRLNFTAETLAPGAPDVTHVFEVVVTDGEGVELEPASTTLTVTAGGGADAGSDNTVDSGAGVTLDGSGSSDTYGTIGGYTWTRTGGTSDNTVNLTGADTAKSTFTADTLAPGVADVTHVFQLANSVTGHNSNITWVSSDTVTVTVTSPFADPVANTGGDRTVISGSTVTLDGSGSTVDRRRTIKSYRWERTSGSGGPVTLTGASTEQPSFTADMLADGADDVTHVFSLVVTDNKDAESVADTVTVTVTLNLPPIADAGPDQRVDSGATVELDGSGSMDPGGTIASYAWSRTGGSLGATVMLSDTSAAKPTFTAEVRAPGVADLTHIFTLTVTDVEGKTNTDTVTVAVMSPNAHPVAEVGPDQMVPSGARVFIDGLRSRDRDGTITRFTWTRTGGTGDPSLVLRPERSSVYFNVETLALGADDVTHDFELVVTDDEGAESEPASITVTVTGEKQADAGSDQTVDSGATVTLDGSGSSVTNGRIVTYQWDHLAVNKVTLSDARASKPSFTADTLAPGVADVTHIFQLQISAKGDNYRVGWAAPPDRTMVTVTSPIADPVADAGPDQTVVSGERFTLDSSGSTVDRRESFGLRYWLQDSRPRLAEFVRAGVALEGRSIDLTAPTLTSDADVTHEFILTVYDSERREDSDSVTVTVTPSKPPDADAGSDQSVPSGEPVTLDGTRSTVAANRTIKSYAWKRTSGTGGSVTLSDASVAQPTFTADILAPGTDDVTHVFTLTVTDNLGETDTDTVTVTVMSPNLPPVAVLGADQTVPSGAIVTIDGRSSTDHDGSVASYSWRRVGGTGSSNLVSTGTPGKLDFWADRLAPGAADVTFTFELVVTDNDGAQSEPVSITITVTTGGGADAGADQTVDSGATVTLDGSGSSMTYGRINSYLWQRTGGTTDGSVTLTSPRSVRPTFVADTLVPGDADVTHEIELQTHVVGQNINVSWVAFDSTTVTVKIRFRLTVVRADGYYAQSGETISLLGFEDTDPRVDIHDRFWLRTGGTGDETLVPEIPGRSGGRGSGTNAMTFTVDSLEPGDEHVTHYFTYNVIDSTGRWVVDDAKVTVFAQFPDPVANAGSDQLVVSGSTVTLDGSSSTAPPNRSITFYGWTRTGGTGDPKVVGYPFLPAHESGLFIPAGWGHHYAPTFTFTADTLDPGATDVTHEFLLRVADESRTTAGDNVTVTVTPSAPPYADAGPDQTVPSGDSVTLDATGSRVIDRRRTITSRTWERTGGTGGSVTLNDSSAAKPIFTAETLEPGVPDVTYEYTLTVTDSLGETDTDTVMITATSPFITMVANAGSDQIVASGATVTLNGTGSTFDSRRIISWEWSRTEGSGNPDILSGSMGQDQQVLTFTADILEPGDDDVTHVFQLAVTESELQGGVSTILNTVMDSVIITVSAKNLDPIANAGPNQTVFFGEPVTLDGRGSIDHDGTNLSYSWARTDGTENSNVKLIDANTSRPTFTTVIPKVSTDDLIHVFTLTVTDDVGATDTDTVTITVTSSPRLPIANAGPDQTVLSGAMFTLNSINSTSDPRREIKTVAWRQNAPGAHSLEEFNFADDGGFLHERALELTAPILNSGESELTLVFDLHITDSDGTEAMDSVSVTVIPSAPPIAEAGPDQMVFSGDSVTLDATGSTITSGRTLKSYIWERTSGTGGSVSLDNINAAMPVFTADTLVPGAEDVTHVFTLVVTDHLGETDIDTMTVTVMSENLAPVAVTGADQTIPSGASVWIDGRGSADRDGTVAHWTWRRIDGTGSRIELSTILPGLVNFQADFLAPGAADVTHIFELVVTDDEGAKSNPAQITITVSSQGGANAGPDQKVPSEDQVTLDGGGSSHVNGSIDSYIWRRVGGTGGPISLINPRTVRPRFTADSLTSDDGDVTHRFELQTFVTGRNINISWVAYDRMTVIVLAPPAVEIPQPQINLAPTARAGNDQKVLSGRSVNLDGSSSTIATGKTLKSYKWERVDGTSDHTVVLIGPNTERPSFEADTLADGAEDVTHIFSLVVTDSTDLKSDPDHVTITVTTRFATPIAEAGPNQTVFSGKTVMLDGTGSTVDSHRTIMSYRWDRTGGTAGADVTLSDAGAAQPTFTADLLMGDAEDVIHEFQLIITDSQGVDSAADTVTITVTVPNVPPTAIIGADQTVPSGSLVSIYGNDSMDSDGGSIVAYAWRRTGGTGTTVLMNGSSPDHQVFRADTLASGDMDVTHIFELIVTDNEGAKSSPVLLTITVAAGSDVDAGDDQTILSGNTVTLDGSGSSNMYGSINSIEWSRTGGTADSVSPNEPRALQTTFTANTLVAEAVDVTHDFELEIGRTGNSNSNVRWVLSDSTQVTITSPFKMPVANAGDDQEGVVQGTTVTLDGSASTKDRRRTITSYAWKRLSGSGATVVPTNADMALATFPADMLEAGAADVDHVFELTVTDSAGDSDTDEVTITITSGFAAPVANAGDDQEGVVQGTTVTLDGSASTKDRRRTITSYAWKRLSGSGATVVPTNADMALATFPADMLEAGAADVDHVFELTVTDSAGDSDTDEVTITITSGFAAPVANAGDDQEGVVQGTTVTLDGSASTKDRRRTITSYAWKRLSGSGATVVPTNADMALATFPADMLEAGAADVDHVFELTVTDSAGDSDTDEVTITITSGFAAPVANAGDDQEGVVQGTTVTLDGSASTKDRRRTITSYAWKRLSGSGATVVPTNADMALATFPADMLEAGAADVDHVFELTVTDSAGDSDTDEVTITITSGFAAPVANAGDDQEGVVQGTTVTLDGSASTKDRRRTITSYAWKRLSGSGATVVPTNADMALATFPADMLEAGAADVDHVFELTVTDSAGDSDTDEVTITITSGFAAPVANAGDDQEGVVQGTTVTLDGSASTKDRRRTITSYAWKRLSGSGATVVPTNADMALATFPADMLEAGAADVDHVFELTVTDSAGDSDTDEVTITITSGFAAPVANAGDDQEGVVQGTTVTLDGSASTKDRRRTITSYAWKRLSGSGATVVPTNADMALATFPADMLEAGAADVDHVFELTVTDSAGDSDTDEVTITITSGFAAPVANAGDDQEGVVQGTTVTLDGSASTKDRRRTITSYAWKRLSGSGATVVPTNADMALATFPADMLEAGAADVDHVFELTVTDSAGDSDTDEVTITITSGFAAPVANAGDDQEGVVQGTTVTLDGSASTKDRRRTITSYAWKRLSGSGATVVPTNADMALATFPADMLEAGAADVDHVFELTVTDSAGDSDTDEVTITITSGFAAPVANAGDDQEGVVQGTTVTLDGSASTKDRRRTITSYAWKRLSGSGATVVPTNADMALATFPADMLEAGAADVDHVFELTVTDSAGDSDTDEVTITITSGFAAPVANAGDDQEGVVQGTTVTLDGSASTKDRRRTITSYAWKRLSGSGATVVPTNADMALATFPADMLEAGAADVDHVFELTVTDSAGDSDTDEVTITITSGFAAPVANAGDDQEGVVQGTTVTLDGSASTKDRRRTITSYAWKRLSGSGATVVPTNADMALATFPADMLEAGAADVDHVFELTVTDSAGDSDTDEVTITITSGFAAPVANAGDDQEGVVQGTTVTLDGSASTKDRRRTITSYAWKRLSGSGATVVPTNADMALATFPADMLEAGAADVDHVFELTVTDSAGDSDTDEVTITITSGFAAPVANAGDDQEGVVQGTTVTLDGSASTKDRRRTITSYAWKRLSGSGATVVPTNADMALATFPADMLEAGAADVDHVFELTVTDSAGDSDTDEVTITITSGFAAPVANAGDDQEGVVQGTTVTLDGSASTKDRRRTITSYAWKRLSGSGATVVPTNADMALATFPADMLEAGAADVDHVFELTVTDSAGDSDTDEVTITITSGFAAPVANAGDDQEGVVQGTTVTLDGSASTKDRRRTITSYAWKRLSGSGATVVPTNADMALATFPADMLEAGAADVDHVFELTVTDSAGDSDTDEVTITITSGFAAPVANAGDDQEGVVQGTTVTLDGSASTKDRRRTITSYAWKRLSGSGATVVPTNADMALATFPADMLEAGAADVDHVFELTVTDSAGDSDTDEVTITITSGFAAPVANAGDDQEGVVQGTTVTLDGSASTKDRRRTITSYAWKRLSGSGATVVPTNADMALATFPADMLEAGAADVDHVFELTVTDSAGDSDTDEVTITITSGFAAPVANAGDDQEGVVQGTTVTLDGSASTKDRRRTITSYAWKRLSGSGATVVPTNADMALATFPADMLEAGAADVDHVFELTVTDSAGDSDTDEVTITITSGFAAPVANAGDDQEGVVQGTTVTLDGSASTKDRRRTITSYAWKRLSGSGATVVPTNADMALATFPADMLEAGAADVDHVFELTVTDSAGDSDTDEVTITITSGFAAPVANAGDDQEGVVQGTTVTLDGSASTKDRRRTITSYAWKRLSGSGATVVPTNADMALATFPADMLEAGAADVDHVFELTVTDSAGDSDTDEVTITITSGFAAPVANAGDDQEGVVQGTTVTLDGSASTKDRRRTITSYAWKRLSGSGATVVPTNADMALATFPADMLEAGAADVDHVFELTVTDSAGDSDTDEVTITITSGFAAPVANAGDDQEGVVQGTTVTLDGSASTKDRRRTITSYAWKRLSGSGATVVPTNADMALATFPADMLEAGAADVDHVFELTVTDSAGDSDTDEVTITITSGFAAPVANAGDDQEGVVQGTTVTLDGSASTKDRRRTITSYAWKRLSGSGATVVPTNADMALATFPADMLEAGAADVDHVFELTVTDSAGDSDTDEVTITITSGFAAPVANAGDDQEGVVQGTTVTLDGSASTKDRRRTITSYAWKRLSGSGATVVPTNADMALATFPADMLEAGAADVDHVFELTVTDSAGDSDTDEVTITITSGFAAPVANAGDDQEGVVQGTTVTLDGSASTKDRRRTITSYAWKRLSGSGATVVPTNADMALATFPADMLEAGAADVDHVFELTVTDSAGDSDTDEVTITITSGFAAPVANAGDDQEGVVQGTTVTLDGSASTKDRRRTITSYAWKRLSGSGATVVPTNADMALATFPADMLEAGAADVDHVFELTVTDSAGDSDTDEVTITITSGFAAPVANAGDDQEGVVQGTTVTLDGSASTKDRRRTITSYAWKRLSGSGATVVPTNADMALATFPADMLEAGAADVDHVFELTVTDSAGDSDTDEVTITITSGFAAPVANAGDDQEGVVQGTTVTLDGSASTKDRRRTITSYAWKRLSGSGATVVPTNADMALATFPADMLEAGAADVDHVFELTVTDSAGDSDTDEVTITITSGFAAPVANAGDDQEGVVQGTTVTLDGSASTKDRRRTITSYAWKRLSGSGATVVPTNADMALATFPADMLEAGAADVDHVFELTVTDSAGDSDTDEVTITITSGFAAPVANAGDDQEGVVQGTTVTLDGSASTKDRRRTITSYAWKRLSGSGATVVPTNADMALATFPADMLEAGAADVDHVFELTVTDSAGDSDTDEVTITITSGFAAPVANAGDDQEGVVQGTTVTLDGSASTKDRRRTITSYAWKRLSGSGATVVPTNADMALATFPADMLEAGAADVDHVFELTVTDSAGDSDTDEVTITITSGFAAPVANAGDDQEGVVQGTTVTLDGSASTKDRRRTITSYAWKRLSGSGATVVPTNADMALATFPADMLEAGAADVDHVFELTVTDSAGDSDTDEVTITITSGFAAPVANAGDDQEGVVQGTTVTLDGSASTKDRRRTITSYAWKRLSGSGATVVPTNADMALATFPADMLEAGAADVDHVFELTVTDSAGDSDTDEVTITITSGFAAPVANAGDDQEGVVQGTTVTLDGSASTKDRRRTITSYAWKRLSGSGATVVPTNADMALATFPADMLEAGAADVDHVFELTVTDSAGDSDTDEVTITITSGFAAPVANAGDDQEGVVQGTTVTLDGSASTKDRRRTITSYAWKRLSGSGATVVPTNADMALATFPADMLEAGAADVDHVFELTVTDSAGDSDTDEVTITITSGFAAPVANAGDDQEGVVQGTTVTLDGSASTKDRRRTITSYAWKRLSGSGATVVPTNADMALATFPADMLEAGAADVDHVFELTVTDSAGDSDTDEVTITITSGFAAPVANAGDDQEGVVQGTTVTLDGSASTKDRRRTITSYAWKRLSGSGATVVPTNADMALATFPADMLEAGAADVDHVFELTVTDSAGDSDTDEVTITITSGFAAPVANAGDDQEGVVQGTTVTLDGSASTKDRRRTITSYAWKRLSGSGATVVPTNADMALATFPADMLEAGAADVDHVFELTVTDSAGDSDTDEVTITITSGFAAPVANAGDDQEGVVQGTTVTLDGSASTKDRRRTITSYAWKRLSGSGATVVPTNADMALATFPADMLEAGAADVDHVFELTVTDSAGDSDTDEVTITITSGFAAPVANAGDDQDDIVPGATVTLDGSGSTADPRRSIAEWNWTQTNGPAVTLDESVPSQPSFTAGTLDAGAEDVIYIFSLIITDSEDVTSESDEVTITVTSGFKTPISNARPVADAGEDQKVASGTTVTLDGSGSTDRDGEVKSYSWRRSAGTGGDIAILANENAPQISFTADTLAPGADDVTHIFELVVTDNEGAYSEPDTVMVTVSVVPLLVGILVEPSELTLQEGGSSAYQVKLSRSPRQEVIVEAVSGNEDVVLNNARLLFNAENWSAWQNVSISTVADSDNADDKALIQHGFDTAGVAVDQSEVVSVTVLDREVDPILRPVGEHLATRATALLNKQRKLIPFLKRDGTLSGGSKEFTLNATSGRLALDGGFVRDGIWGEVTGTYTRSDSGDIKSVSGSFGHHWKNSERFLAGVMLQFDLAENDLAGRAGSIDGAGWLAGPYFAARHGTQPLYFEGRLLYGQSNNDFRFNDPDLGERRGSFDTRRLLAQIRMEGEIALSVEGDGARLIPYADARWMKERAKGFTDRLGNRVPGQKVGIGQLEFGSSVKIPIVTAYGAMTFFGGLGVVYANAEGDYIRSESRGRGRGEMGFSYDRDDNIRIDFESFYDGIGTSAEYKSYGLSLNAEMKF